MSFVDNLKTHKLKHDRWLRRHRNVHLYYFPTHASWLNQIEVWFSNFIRQALQELSAASVRDICQAIDAFTDTRNQHTMLFEWTRSVVHPVSLKHRYAELYK